MTRPFHIIAAKPPGGMTSQQRDNGGHNPPRAVCVSAGRPEARKSANPFDETRRLIEAKLREGCQTRLRADRHVTIDDDLDADLRIIGYGLAAGTFFAVILRLSQMGWLS